MKVKVYNSHKDKLMKTKHASFFFLPAFEYENCLGLRMFNVYVFVWKIVFFLHPEQ